MIKVIYQSIETLRDGVKYRALLDMVSPYRREKVEKLMMDADRKRSLLVGAIMEQYLSRIHLHEKNMEYQLTESGRLSFKKGVSAEIDEKLYGLHFSISHSGEYTAVAFSNHVIGMDFQEISDRSWYRIAEHFFPEEELQRIKSLSTEEEQKALFYRLYTQKEAYYKCYGAPNQGMKLDFSVEKRAEEEGFYVKMLFPESNYVMSIVCPREEEIELERCL